MLKGYCIIEQIDDNENWLVKASTKYFTVRKICSSRVEAEKLCNFINYIVDKLEKLEALIKSLKQEIQDNKIKERELALKRFSDELQKLSEEDKKRQEELEESNKKLQQKIMELYKKQYEMLMEATIKWIDNYFEELQDSLRECPTM